MLHTLPFAAVAERLPSGATEAFWLAVRGTLDLLSEARGWWDVVAGTIVPPVIEGEQQFLHTALETLPPEPWNGSVWTTWTDAIKRATGRNERRDSAATAPRPHRRGPGTGTARSAAADRSRPRREPATDRRRLTTVFST